MTTILMIFFGTIYGFSGLTCSMAFLRHINKLLSSQKSPQYAKLPLASMAITLFWPLWIVKEIWYHEPDESDTSEEVEEVNCKMINRANNAVQSGEKISSNINSGCIELV
ncbi:hypothetical protein [Limnofasciculus baicalensis]|uniref:Uncharacterized protein n=1 Tax=Limnofasciculus baicalensis BBK-W-15 TaxID=2699891 RepID=A0AAE3GTM3_9CYAN|nr:hypothetical protein [Limnofasciculus baicalensis]MCP2729807.1 hypothetical protein [Limnofasciculus baicalensis BBK-W-15]